MLGGVEIYWGALRIIGGFCGRLGISGESLVEQFASIEHF